MDIRSSQVRGTGIHRRAARSGARWSLRAFPLAAALALFGTLLSPAGAARQAAHPEPSLTVTGIGQVSEPAAEAELDFVVGSGAYYGMPGPTEGGAFEGMPQPSESSPSDRTARPPSTRRR